jgi:hypothetical protein
VRVAARSAVAGLLKVARVDTGWIDGAVAVVTSTKVQGGDGRGVGCCWSCQVTLGDEDGAIEVSSGSCSTGVASEVVDGKRCGTFSADSQSQDL